MKLAMRIFVLAILLGFPNVSLAQQIIEPGQLRPGQEAQGPFEVNPFAGPDTTPMNTSGPWINVPEGRSKNGNGDVAAPGTPVINATPPPIKVHINDDGSTTVEPSPVASPQSLLNGLTHPLATLTKLARRLGPAEANAQTVSAQFNGGLASGLTPADAAGATNGSFVLSALNNAYYIYGTGGTLLKSRDGNGFWCNGPQVVNGCPSTGLNGTTQPLETFDTQIVWDSVNARWVTSALGATASQLSSGTWMPVTYLGVSQTSDPRGMWNLYYFYTCGDNNPGDQPKLGIDSPAGWIIVESSLCNGSIYPKNNLQVFSEASLYAGTPPNNTNQFPFSDPNDLDRPAVTYAANPPSGREYLVASAVAGGTPALYYSFLQNDPSTGKPLLTSNVFSVFIAYITGATFDIPAGSDARCNACIGTLDDARVRSATVQTLSNGDLFIIVPFNFAMAAGGTQIYLEQLDLATLTTVGGMSGSSGGTIFYPSAAADLAGDKVLLNFGFTAPGNPALDPYPYTDFWFLDSLGSGESLFGKAGVAANAVSARWGDYTTTTPDFASSGAAWSLGSYLDSNGRQHQWWMNISK